MTFILQVIIIQFGSIAFFTVGLTIEQWLWCLFFGIGQIVFAQVVWLIKQIIQGCISDKTNSNGSIFGRRKKTTDRREEFVRQSEA